MSKGFLAAACRISADCTISSEADDCSALSAQASGLAGLRKDQLSAKPSHHRLTVIIPGPPELNTIKETIIGKLSGMCWTSLN